MSEKFKVDHLSHFHTHQAFIAQGIIQKKPASGSQMLPLVLFDKKVAVFSKNSVILRYFWVKLSQKCPFFKDPGCCPKILDNTLSPKNH